MKKIFIFIVLLLVFPGKNIKANEVDSKSYKQNSVNVVESQTVLYYSTYSNIQVYWQDLYVDGEYSFCLKFEDLIKNGSSHRLEEPSNYYTDEHWNEITLYAMYATRRFEQTGNKNYHYAAQALIHESFETKSNGMKFYTLSNGLKKEFSVNTYKEELVGLYKSHITTPSIDLSSTDFKVGESYLFEDTNNVIENYTLESSDNIATYTVEDSQLKIDVNSEGEGYFSFKSDTYSKDGEVLLWVASSLQDLITVTAYNPAKVDYSFTSSLKTGTLEVSKVDSSTKDYLVGAEFSVKKFDGVSYNDVESFTVDNKYVLNDLEVGKYQLVETKAPDGYVLSSRVFDFEITRDGEVVVIEVENSKTLSQTGFSFDTFSYLFLLSIFLFVIRFKTSLKYKF